jgi:hypothetical protein
MNFTVLWTAAAQQELAAVWLAAADREAVTTASYRIEVQIRANPLETGESRDENERIVFDPPLVVVYVVDEPNRTAWVTTVALSRRRK